MIPHLLPSSSLQQRPPAQPARGTVRAFIATALLTTLALALPVRAASTLPSDYYDILNRKNIFSKNRIIPRRDEGPTRPRGPQVHKVYTPVLIGAMLEDDGYVAFIVDPESHNIVTARSGDVLPSNAGTLKEVTLDYIVTDPGKGKPANKVLLGQNILGGAAEYPDSDNASASSGDSGSAPSANPDNHGEAGTQPAGPAPAGGSVDDITERLRKRRQAQLGK
ncbi:MAG TPA: hypothetical protein VM008_03730 [Phycisphaerae bacterium]|nr:hypothetical protein [Phycisphaerae bacterium]